MGLDRLFIPKKKVIFPIGMQSPCQIREETSKRRDRRFCAVYMGIFFSLWEYFPQGRRQASPFALSQCETNITERKVCRI
jgi:hypothetical protein